jgi:hypothetical protein
MVVIASLQLKTHIYILGRNLDNIDLFATDVQKYSIGLLSQKRIQDEVSQVLKQIDPMATARFAIDDAVFLSEAIPDSNAYLLYNSAPFYKNELIFSNLGIRYAIGSKVTFPFLADGICAKNGTICFKDLSK